MDNITMAIEDMEHEDRMQELQEIMERVST